jgi:hypothetical protein
MRLLPPRIRFWTALLLLLYWTGLHIAPAAAALAPSAVTGTTGIASTRDADLIMARQVLEHRIVAQKLRDYGIDPAAAEQQLSSMSDQDLHTLASASKGLPSGADDGLGLLVTILIIVLLVILILKLMNKEIVVK